MTKITVILSIFTSNFEESLESIFNQTIDEIEIICINYTKRNISHIQKKYYNKNITILTHKSENLINKSIELSDGEYLAFLDNHNIFLDKDALSKMYSIAKEKNAVIIGSNYKILNDLTSQEEYNDVFFNENDFDKTIIIPSEKYNINTPIQTNIVNKNFLLENNIQFSNCDINNDKIFLAKILSKLKNITILNTIFLYCKNLSTENDKYLRLNSFEKKEKYIEQFKNIFEFLENNELNELLIKYKKEFINYLLFKENINDNEIVNIISEHEFDRYFNENDYGYRIIEIINNPLKTRNEDYILVKECLFQQNMLQKKVIEIDFLKEFIKISKKNNEYNNSRYSLKKLKEINDTIYLENSQLKSKIIKLKKENMHYSNINEAILSSNSWKFTKPIRSIKKVFTGEKDE